MKLNQNINIVGNKTILVPYRRSHVLKYHEWMKNPMIRELTASEPLTLEEEFNMQQSWKDDEDTSMVGDVNLFISTDGEEREEANDENSGTANRCGELEVMIAEEAARGRGYGHEAVLSMLFYGIKYLKLSSFLAKIGFKNGPSHNLFKKFGFNEISRSDVFEEITYSLKITPDVEHELSTISSHLNFTCDRIGS